MILARQASDSGHDSVMASSLDLYEKDTSWQI